MEPVMMLFGVLMLPLVALLLIGAPVYVGIYTSLYWMYQPTEDWVPHPLRGRFWEVGTIFNQYVKVVDYSGLTLQIMVPPLLGVVIAVVLIYAFYRYMLGQFSVDGI